MVYMACLRPSTKGSSQQPFKRPSRIRPLFFELRFQALETRKKPGLRGLAGLLNHSRLPRALAGGLQGECVVPMLRANSFERELFHTVQRGR